MDYIVYEALKCSVCLFLLNVILTSEALVEGKYINHKVSVKEDELLQKPEQTTRA